MVEFVTLLLGALIAGPAEIALRVDGEVSSVELQLDGAQVAKLRGSPWQAEVDFGAALVPHLLEAVARDSGGRELGRARQWVNLAPRQSEVTLTLDRDRPEGGVAARLSWQSLSADNVPVSVQAIFDGVPLDATGPHAIPLPDFDPDRLHHLRVELEFPGGVRSEAELTFGGVFGDSVASELTAFPISLPGRRKLPPVEQMDDWFRSGDQPLQVHAVEKGLAEILVVRSPAAERRLTDLLAQVRYRPVLPLLLKDHRLRFFGVTPDLVAGEQSPFVVFPRSDEIEVSVGGLLEALGALSFSELASEEVRIADAVAVAGLFANRSGRRRAVVLITTRESIDESQFTPEQVRPYLESIGVPLFVWCPEEIQNGIPGWGRPREIWTTALLDGAYRELRRELEAQRIVWLNGSLLPQDIEVHERASGVDALH